MDQRHEHKRCGAYIRHLLDSNPDTYGAHEDVARVMRGLASDLELGRAQMPFPGFDETTGDYETPGFLRRGG